MFERKSAVIKLRLSSY